MNENGELFLKWIVEMGIACDLLSIRLELRRCEYEMN